MAKVREQFDSAGPLIGRPWPLDYRGDDDERVGAAARARRTPLHRRCPTPTGRASRRTSTTGPPSFAAAVPECLSSATFFPEHGVGDVRRRAASTRAREIFKVHVQVGDFDLDRPAARRGVGHARGRRHPGRHPRRRRTGRQRPHRPRPGARRCWSGTRA